MFTSLPDRNILSGFVLVNAGFISYFRAPFNGRPIDTESGPNSFRQEEESSLGRGVVVDSQS
jgi:hypothetical protein